jgi:hypothetical protein
MSPDPEVSKLTSEFPVFQVGPDDSFNPYPGKSDKIAPRLDIRQGCVNGLSALVFGSPLILFLSLWLSSRDPSDPRSFLVALVMISGIGAMILLLASLAYLVMRLSRPPGFTKSQAIPRTRRWYRATPRPKPTVKPNPTADAWEHYP